MKLTKCEQCGGPTAEGLPLCPDCMRATGAAADQIAAAEELRDIARVLSITANTDANIREAIVWTACLFWTKKVSAPCSILPGSNAKKSFSGMSAYRNT